MSGYLTEESRAIAQLESQAATILPVFANRGYARVDPPVLQPADVFLDRSGEEIRRRTFLLTDPAGRELCLRPELTIPVCRLHLERGGEFPARICYHGPAFRMRSAADGSTQFLQTGVEYLGAPDREKADAEVLSLAVEALRAAGLKEFSVQIGDASLFPGLMDAIVIPAPLRERLKRHFRRPESFERVLRRLSSGEPAAPSAAWLAKVASAEEAGARAALSGLLDLLGGAASREAFAGRSRDEIIDRLMEQAAESASLRLAPESLAVIESAIAIAGPAEKSLTDLQRLLEQHGVSLDHALQAMAQRLAVLRNLGLAGEQVVFAPRFGRNLDYYTGFIFEISTRGANGPLPVAGGGRYDSLLKLLGAPGDIPAVGCAIRDERVLAARNMNGERR
jgi:ATP phosphoribosyltransferase regulatory subunit